MKKLIILFIITFSIIQAQDSEPTPWGFVWGHSSLQRPLEIDSFPQTSIMTGFQWSGSWQMNNALLNNASAIAVFHPVGGTINQKLNLIYPPTWRGRNGFNPGYFNAPSMQYEPTLPLSGTNEGTIRRPADSTDPVFGFRYRRGRISTTPSDPNYSRIILEKDSSYIGGRVLENIWPQPNFRTRDWVTYRAEGHTDNYLGRRWYLTINLKSLEPISNSNPDSVILTIRLPYKVWKDSANKQGRYIDSNYVKFKNLPDNS